jgi:sensor domain CHASE-containing protein
MKFIDYLKTNFVHILMVLFVLVMASIIFSLTKKDYEELKNPTALKEVKGVQNHLVWDVNGNCYFVRPHNEYTNYLITVPDCNKVR